MAYLLNASVVKKRNNSNGQFQNGQALIIILLAMTVVLTLVLSAVSRTLTDVDITTHEEEALRAFSAAEAGVEQALLDNTTTPFGSGAGFSGHNTEFYVEFPENATDSVYQLPTKLLPAEVGTFWFVKHNDDGELTCDGGGCTRTAQLQACFGDSASPVQPAVEVQIYYDDTGKAYNAPGNDYSDVKVKSYIVGSVTGANMGANSGCTGAPNLKYSSDNINVPGGICGGGFGCLVMAKVRMLKNYDGATPVPMPVAMRMIGGPEPYLPAQGVTIQSTGTSGNATRRLNVTKSFAVPPDIFGTTVYSGRNMMKEP